MEEVKIDQLRELLCRYEGSIASTDRLSYQDHVPVLMGLYGEVGSIMATSKKAFREDKAFIGYRSAVEEEFGDVFWYLSALCRRLSVNLEEVFIRSLAGQLTSDERAVGAAATGLNSALLELGWAAAELLKLGDSNSLRGRLFDVVGLYCKALRCAGLDFMRVVEGNLEKALGRFADPVASDLIDFDAKFPLDEQLPRHFEIHVTERANGQCFLQWKGVFIGDPLGDNISEPDGYRFHDVFHMAHAVVLHWSPTFRSLIKQKRKSDRATDVEQDGGRAVVVEEGLTAWLFSYAKNLNFFEGHSGVSFDVLKNIQRFVQGYEVERCPLKLWEDAIIQGYRVFREVKRNNGGIVIGNRVDRKLSYRPLVR